MKTIEITKFDIEEAKNGSKFIETESGALEVGDTLFYQLRKGGVKSFTVTGTGMSYTKGVMPTAEYGDKLFVRAYIESVAV